MSLFQIKNAFEQRLNAFTGKLPTAWENLAFKIPVGDAGEIRPYQTANLLPAPPENPCFGADMYREVGLFQIQLFYPLNGGAGIVYGMAEQLRDWFERGTTMTFDDVSVIVQRTPTIGPGRTERDRYLLPISITYFANIL